MTVPAPRYRLVRGQILDFLGDPGEADDPASYRYLPDGALWLADGKVAAQGTPDEVRASSDPLIRQFVGMDMEGPVEFHYPGPTVEQDFGIEVAR